MDLYVAQKRIIDILSSPFPGNCDLGSELRINLLIGLFVALFLYMFQPYGMSQYQGNMLLLVTWFGLATFVGSFSYFLFVTYVLKIRQDAPSFTFGKWLFFILVLMVVITLCNFLVFWLLNDRQVNLNWTLFINLFIKTAAIGFFPVSISGLIIFFRNNKFYDQQARNLDLSGSQNIHGKTKEVLHLPSQYADDFVCETENIYAFEAQDNYVAIRYLADNTLKTSLIRNSLSAIEAFLPAGTFIRCHRSYITNLHKIDKVSGNAQGLVLTLKNSNLSIPVSRSYINNLKAQIGSI